MNKVSFTTSACVIVISLSLASCGGEKEQGATESKRQEDAAKAISEARAHVQRKEYKEALAACTRAIEADRDAYDAYTIRWATLAELWGTRVEIVPPPGARQKITILAPPELRQQISSKIEAFLESHKETPKALDTAYWGYMFLPGYGRTDNVPEDLFTRMLQYPKTEAWLSALLGLAEKSDKPREKWDYYRRIIDESTAEDFPELSLWYAEAHTKMLKLAEQESGLADDEYLDELIDRYLQAHLTYSRSAKQWSGVAYTDAVKWRLKFGIKLDKASEALEQAERTLKEKETQEWLKQIGGNPEEVQKSLAHLRDEISQQQGR